MTTDPDNGKRASDYQVNEEVMGFLMSLNSSLEPLEQRLRSEQPPSSMPIAIIGGLQRSGTTLLYQLLAQFCEVSYIDNLVARFWKAPLVGAMLSRCLFGSTMPAATDLASDYGVTSDIRGPHEFGYFWTDWLHLDSAATHVLTAEETTRVDWPGLADCLRKISGTFGLPLVVKNPIACWNSSSLFAEFSGFRAIVVRRDPFYIVQSTYQARQQRYGDMAHWWSLKPPSYEEIRREPDPIRQVAAQVEASRRVFEQMIEDRPGQCIAVDYQDIRTRPRDVVQEISDFCGWQVREGVVFPSPGDLPDGDRCRVAPEEARRIEQALADLPGGPSV